MKKENPAVREKSAAEINLERILNAKVDSRYIPVDDLPIPTMFGVLIKPLEEESMLELKSGILMSTEKTNPSRLGILYQVGPKCSEFLRIGMRCRYIHGATDRFYHLGEEYVQTDESGVLYLIPNENTHSLSKHKDGNQLRKEAKIADQPRIDKLDKDSYENERDKRQDKTKGKIRTVS